jgi:hypothetical protein
MTDILMREQLGELGYLPQHFRLADALANADDLICPAESDAGLDPVIAHLKAAQRALIDCGRQQAACDVEAAARGRPSLLLVI